MNDLYEEKLVSRKKKPVVYVAMILMSLTVIGIALLTFVLGSLMLFFAVILGVIFYFLSMKLNIEYEYLLVNSDLRIDVIYSKRSRKETDHRDIHDVQTLYMYNSKNMKQFADCKIRDYSSGTENEGIYALIFADRTCLLIEPGERMADAIKRICGQKFR